MSLFKKKINPINPLLQIWIKWYTEPISVNIDIYHTHPELQNILRPFLSNFVLYQRNKLYVQQDKTDYEILVEIFNLDSPLSELELSIIQVCGTSEDLKLQYSRLIDPLIPIFFRYLIHFSYQFSKNFSSAISGDLNKQLDSYNIFPLLNFLQISPPFLLKDAYSILEPFFSYLLNSFSRDSSYLSSKFVHIFSNELIQKLSPYIAKCLDNHEALFLNQIITFYGNYLIFWLDLSSNDDFTIEDLHSCILILKSFISLSMDIIQNNYQMFMNVMKTGFSYLSLTLVLSQNFPNQDIFDAGLFFLQFFTHFSISLSKTSNDIWKNFNSNSSLSNSYLFVAPFVVWTINSFPFSSFDVPKTIFYLDKKGKPSSKNDISDINYIKIKSIDEISEIGLFNQIDISDIISSQNHQQYSFILESTFTDPLVSNLTGLVDITKYQNDSIFQQYLQGSYESSSFSPFLSENHNVYSLLNILIQISSFQNASSFIEQFFGILLSYAKNIFLPYNLARIESSNPLRLSLSILFFVMEYLNFVDLENLINIFSRKIKPFQLFFNMFYMDPISILYQEKKPFYSLIRHEFFHILGRLFIDSQILRHLILQSLYDYLENATPQMFDEPLLFLYTLAIQYPDYFSPAFIDSSAYSLRCLLIKKVSEFQAFYLKIKHNEQIPEEEKYLENLSQTRRLLFALFEQLVTNMTIRKSLFSSSSFLNVVFHLIFEKDVSQFALGIISKGLSIDSEQIQQSFEFDLTFYQLKVLINELLKFQDDENYIHLASDMLHCLNKVFTVNRRSLIPSIQKFQILDRLADLPKMSNNIDIHLDLTKLVLMTYIPIAKDNPEMRKTLKNPMSKIESQKKFEFNVEIIETLLHLCFEQPVSLESISQLVGPNLLYHEIQNQRILSILHEATKNCNKIHSCIFNYIEIITHHSITNKLQVYHSDLFKTILQYIQSFEYESPAVLAKINTLLTLFTTVGSVVFKWQTLFRALQYMRETPDHHRNWWTSQLVSCFTEILNQNYSNIQETDSSFSTSLQKLPTSFFHFDGRHSGIFLPKFNASFLSGSKFTFHTRIEFDSDICIHDIKACLFSLRSLDGNNKYEGFDILLNEKSFTVNTMNKIYEIDLKLEKSSWYDICFVSNVSSASLYINGILVYTFKDRDFKIKFDSNAQISGAICNTVSGTGPEKPLVCNLTCAHLYSGILDSNTIGIISRLPIDFIYAFSKFSLSMYQDIESISSLQSNDILQNNLIFCYNARMTIENSCINVASTNRLQSNYIAENAKAIGQMIPFSTTFCTVSENLGGISIFLPLFEQIDSPVKKDPNLEPPVSHESDSSIFLRQLLKLIESFLKASIQIQQSFLNTDLFKALAFLLSKLNPDTLIITGVKQLYRLYLAIENDSGKIKMLKDVWLNSSLWSTRNKDVQIFVINELLSSDMAFLLPAATTVGELVLHAMNEKDSSIRECWWKVASRVAQEMFSVNDQDFFVRLPSDVNIDSNILSEAMDIFLILFDNKVGNCHSSIIKYGLYNPFIKLFSSDDENVRLLGLKFLLSIAKFQLSGDLPSSIDPSSKVNVFLTFEEAIQIAISKFNSSNMSLDYWNFVIDRFFNLQKYHSGLFPLISFLSHFYSADDVLMFVVELDSKLEFPFEDHLEQYETNSLMDQKTLYRISYCKLWEFWLFYLMLQCNDGIISVSYEKQSESPVWSIYAKIIVNYLVNQKFTEAQEAFTFLYLLEFSHTSDGYHLSMNGITRTIFQNVLKYYQSYLMNSTIPLIVYEMFTYLVYIPKYSPFSNNYALLNKYGIIPSNLMKEEIKGKIIFNDFIERFQNFSYNPEEFSLVFSLRIDEEGRWKDNLVATTLCNLIFTSDKGKTKFNQISLPCGDGKNTVKIFDIGLLLLGYISRSSPESTNSLLKDHFELNEYQIQLLTSQLIYSKNPFLQKLLSQYSNLLQNKDYCESIAQTYSNFLENLDEKFSKQSELIKSRVLSLNDSIICKIFLKQFTSSPSFDLINQNNNSRKYLMFNAEQARLSISTEKAYKGFWVDLVSNNGPWKKDDETKHWKLSQRTDLSFHRLFLHPNLNFDLHVKASISRDAGSSANADRLYAEWLESHPEEEQEPPSSKTENDQSTELIVIDDDQIQQIEKDYVMSLTASRMTVTGKYEGTFILNSESIIFSMGQKVTDIPLQKIVMILQRSYGHIPTGLEFFTTKNKSYLFYFSKESDKRKVFYRLKRILQGKPQFKWIQEENKKADLVTQMKLTEQWSNGSISNYDYLIMLNLLSGRSFNDCSQYPVFPWILSNYESESIDLSNPENFRDLSKPIGTLNETRLNGAKSNYAYCLECGEQAQFWNSFYSTSYYVCLFLIRIEPFASMHISMQDGRFDKSSRIFGSILKSWEGINSVSSDYRELIPEFFTLPNFLINENGFDLGKNEGSDEKLDDVKLPNWASTPEMFIAIHREALESPYVSSHLNQWIDLIFGYKQNGEKAEEVYNIFPKSCYESSITPEILADPDQLSMIQNAALEFGIVPHQLFQKPHPPRQFTFSIPKMIPDGSSGAFLCYQIHSKPLILMSFQSYFDFKNKNTLDYIKDGIFLFDKSGRLTFLSKKESTESNAINMAFGEEKYKGVTLGEMNSSILKSEGRNHFALFPQNRWIVISTGIENSFHLYVVFHDGVITFKGSGCQRSALLTGIIVAGKDKLFTFWNDSSLALFDLNNIDCPIYRVTPHRTSLIDVDVSEKLDLIASLDKGKILVLSLLSNGRFMRLIQLNDNEDMSINFCRVIINNHGYISIIGQSEKTLIIKLLGLDGKLLGVKSFSESTLSCVCSAEIFGGIAGICIGLESGRTLLLKLPSLDIGLDEICSQKPTLITFSSTLNKLFVTAETGNIYYINVC